ncbi:MAG: methionyl-tRNA formyltransferase [Candidatus Parcubacteria bacterium]|nr:methionyl-tRNA formyltransferase [Candidatus Parcubacteria bacterium]
MKNNLKELKVIFMGTPDFGVPVFVSLIHSTNVIAAVTQPDKKVGRKQEITQSPIKEVALENKIRVLQPLKVHDNSEFIQQVKDLQPDLIIVVAYGFILPQEILDIPKFGVINIHASLLPKYRGASPIQAAILNGDKETGVTIMLIDDKMDHGPLLGQRTITINDNDNFESVHDRLSQLGSELLMEILPEYLAGEIEPQVQDEAEATYCQLIKKEYGKIDWNKSAQEIERQVRAFNSWPGSWTDWNNKNLKVIKAVVYASTKPVLNQAEGLSMTTGKIGEVFKVNDGLAVACGQDALEILELQLEGKKPMNAKDFLNGYSDIIGSIIKK